MGTGELHVVTGAFGYTGKYIARRLLAAGMQVRTLTGHPDRPDPFAGQVTAVPFHFDRPDLLAENLHGARTLYNTYWVRFPHRGVTFEHAVQNTRALIRAAQAAGVRRIVHLSITNPAEDSPLPYFGGKAQLERAVIESRLSYGIIRPTVVFGAEDILINNIAWFLRRFPVFAVPGDGRYPIQPIFVEDLAELAVDAGQGDADVVIDAVGPETYTFNALARRIGQTVGSKARIVHVPPRLAHLTATIIGWFVKDVVLTGQEVEGLMTGLLVSRREPTGRTHLSHWLAANADTLGRRYASELSRHYRR